jgi:hypothetical protein
MPEELYKHEGERRIALVEIFEGKAQWRRQKAVEHPATRGIWRRPQSWIGSQSRLIACHPPPSILFFELYEDYEGNEELRQVGFHFDPKTAEDFCRSYIASRTIGRSI